MNQVEIKRRQIQLCSLALGLAIIWIFGRTLGDNGVAYLVTALEAFVLAWEIIGAEVADTLGKLLRGRNARGQYKNAEKLCQSVLVVQGVLGLLGSVLFCSLAGWLAQSVFKVPHSQFLMMILAPVLFLRVINGVLMGSFQGDGSELPTSAASVLRPLLILGFGSLLGRILAAYGEKVSNLLGEAAFTSMYGGMGIAIAVLLAEVLIFGFLLFIYMGSRGRKKRETDGMRTTDSYVGQLSVFYGNLGFSILLGVLFVLPLVLGLFFYRKSTLDVAMAVDSYGLYAGKYLVVCGIVTALLAAVVLPVAVRTAVMLRRDDLRMARSAFQSGLKSIMIYGLFLTVLFAVMAEQMATIFSKSGIEVFAKMLTAGSGIVVLGVLAYFCCMVLKLAGKKYLVLGGLVISCIVYTVILAILCGKESVDIMVLIYSGLIYMGVLALLLCSLTCVILRNGLDWLRIVAIPVGSVCVAGLIGYFLGKALTPHLGAGVAFLVIFVLAWLIHLVLVIFLRTFGEQELNVVPGGKALRALGQLLRVF